MPRVLKKSEATFTDVISNYDDADIIDQVAERAIVIGDVYDSATIVAAGIADATDEELVDGITTIATAIQFDPPFTDAVIEAEALLRPAVVAAVLADASDADLVDNIGTIATAIAIDPPFTDSVIETEAIARGLLGVDGTIANPWTTATTGEAGILALEAAAGGSLAVDQYGIIGSGSDPVLFRYGGDGIWYRPGFGELGTYVALNEEDPSAGGFSESTSGTGVIDYNTTVAGKILIRSPGTAASSSISAGTAEVKTGWACIVLTGAAISGTPTGATYFRFLYDNGVGARRQLILNANAGTYWNIMSGTVTYHSISTAAVAATHTIEVYEHLSSAMQLVFVDREPYPSLIVAAVVTSTTASTALLVGVSTYVSNQVGLTFDRVAGGYLD